MTTEQTETLFGVLKGFKTRQWVTITGVFFGLVSSIFTGAFFVANYNNSNNNKFGNLSSKMDNDKKEVLHHVDSLFSANDYQEKIDIQQVKNDVKVQSNEINDLKDAIKRYCTIGYITERKIDGKLYASRGAK